MQHAISPVTPKSASLTAPTLETKRFPTHDDDDDDDDDDSDHECDDKNGGEVEYNLLISPSL
jgi:hypothetical protein